MLASVTVAAPAIASDYGTTGLIDIPTARMSFDGAFTSTIAKDQYTQSYAITYQALPWLEGTFRYTGFNEFFYWDRNYEAKVRLLQESEYLPQVAVGIRDLVGTGLFGGEYLVASKAFGNADVTLGMGWGRFADDSSLTNPLTWLSDTFEARNNDFGVGGTLSSDAFFRGPNIGLFAGVEYQVADFGPWGAISLMAEYQQDQYRFEQARTPSLNGVPGAERAAPSSPLSFAVEYAIADTLTLALSHQHGDGFGLRIQGVLDTGAAASRYQPPAFVSSLDTPANELPAGIRKNRWYDMLLYDIERANVFLLSAKLYEEQGRAELEIGNDDYPYWPDAVQQAHLFASLHLPESIRQIDYVVNEQGHCLHRVRLPRETFLPTMPRITMADNAQFMPGRAIEQPSNRTGFVKDKVFIDLTLANRLMLFDPDNPLGYQIYLKAGTSITLPRDLKLRGAYRFNLMNNFDQLNRVSDSVLPRVRSDALKYLKEGLNGVQELYLEQRGSSERFPRVHYRIFGGILEDMFSGVGGEALYQPYGSRLAYGISAAYAKQRDYDGAFSHLDYEVLTAHASVYWATPFYNYDVAVHAGRYLAKDVGATFEVRRTFDNGWQVGLWATLTDVPFEEFGEGSFDKGMFFRVPLDQLFSGRTKATYKTRIRPIQRDGGARLEGFSGEIWWETRDARYDLMHNSRHRGQW